MKTNTNKKEVKTEFKYGKIFTSEDYLNNRDVFSKKITNGINQVDALMVSGIVDSFYIDEYGIIFLNFNEDKIKKLVKEWKA